MSISDNIQEPFIYGRLGENSHAPGSRITLPQRIQFEPFEDPMIPILTRIADALDRAYPIPIPAESTKLKVGIAAYHYDDPQTLELRELANNGQIPPTNG